MPRPFRQIGPSGRRDSFQPDRYGYSERRRRQEASLRHWWDDATPMERVIRIWWWVFCAIVGWGFGVAVICLAAAIIVFVSGG